MFWKPRVFVASSKEAAYLANAIKENLTDTEVIPWYQAFQVGHTIMGELDRNLKQSNFGIFVFAPNDIAIIRGQTHKTVRDNVILELGMFMGQLGKERSFIVRPKGSDMHLPTDLAGIIPATYNRKHTKRYAARALEGACKEISNAIKIEQRKKLREMSTLVKEYLKMICSAMANPVSPREAALRAFVFQKEGNELVCRGKYDPDESIEEVGKLKFTIGEEFKPKFEVVRAFMEGVTTSSSEIRRSPKGTPGFKGRIKGSIKYIVASPIHKYHDDGDDTPWGVVDFDTSNPKGLELLENEGMSKRVLRHLAADLSEKLAR